MPTNHDETLEQQYAREQSEHLAELTKRTPEEIAYMEQLLHNVLAERDHLATKVADLELALFAENQKRQDVERERDQLRGALELMLERVPEPPEANCSCHLSPPCNDCIEYGGEREAFEFAKDVVAAANGDAA